MKQELLHVQDLNKTMFGQEVFRHLNFDLFAGETLCMLIPPLSGKTTLVKILQGDEDYTGTISFNGIPVKNSLKEFNSTGEILCLSRSSPLIPTLTIGENMFLRPHKRGLLLIGKRRDLKEAQPYLDYLGLGISADKMVREVDLFTQHMAMIAYALHHGLRMVVFDDPRVYYDREQMRQTTGVLRLLHEKGVAVLWLAPAAFPLETEVLDRLILIEDYRKTRTFFHPGEFQGRNSETGTIGSSADEETPDDAYPGAARQQMKDRVTMALCMSSVKRTGIGKIDLMLERGAAIGIQGKRLHHLQSFYNLFLPNADENTPLSGSFIIGGTLRKGNELHIDFGSRYVAFSDTFAHDQLLEEQSILDNVFLPLSSVHRLPMFSFSDGFRKSLSLEIQDRLGIPVSRQSQPAGILDNQMAQELILLRIELQRPAFVLYFSPYSRLEQAMQERLEQAFRRFRNAGIGLLIAAPGIERFRSLLTDYYSLTEE